MLEECTDLPGSSDAGSSLAPGKKIWRAGTLAYTRRGLVMLFVWLLWGDLCFSLMEQIIPTLLPLDLKEQAASNTLIGLIVGTIPSAMNMVFTPVIAFRSDRHRGRWGRRIPYLLWSAPVISLFLVITGLSPRIGTWLHSHVAAMSAGLSQSATIILTIAIASVLFQFFNLFVLSVYYYLFRDVVPEEWMGRFVGLFRVVGAAGLFVYNRYVFGLSGTYREQIYIGVAVLYGLSFMLMCWGVKEGEYPPPPPVEDGGSWIGSLKTYIKECFSQPKMLLLYLVTSTYASGVAAINTFLVFFGLSLGLSRDDFGKFNGWAWLIPAIFSIPLGYMVDKLQAIRLSLFGVALMAGTAMSGFIGIQGQRTLLITMLVLIFGKAIYDVSMLPLLMKLLPADRFGQFASANAVCSAIGYMLGSYGAGRFLDAVQSYRYVYFWCAIFTGISTVFLSILYVTTRSATSSASE